MTKQIKEKKDLKNETMTEELTTVLEEIVQEEPAEKKKGETVKILDDVNIMIGEREYRIAANHRDGFNAEKLGERFSEVLSRYDYIVGDWGYEQLRLKGFFHKENRKAFPDQRIDSLEDYLYEYCNFGCAYFVIERIGGKRERKQNRRRRNKKPAANQQTQMNAHIAEKKAPVQSVKKTKPTIKNRKDSPQNTKKPNTPVNNKEGGNGFVIRKRED